MSVETRQGVIFVDQNNEGNSNIKHIKAVPINQLKQIERESKRKGHEFYNTEINTVLGDPADSLVAWSQVVSVLASE